MSVLKDIAGSLGVLPQLAAKGGKNAGFVLGILPGMLYRDQYKDDEEEKRMDALKQASAMVKQASAMDQAPTMKKGGKVMSASKRADGIAQRGKTRGKVI